MVKSRAARARKKKVKAVVVRPQKAVQMTKPTFGATSMARYLQLLYDPCGADLAYPTYAGTDAGYLVRTTDHIGLTATGAGMVAGTTVQCSAVVQYSPWNYCSPTNIAYNAAAFAPGGVSPGVMAFAAAGSPTGAVTNFMNNAVVGRFRPVAACLRWVPTGPYTSRQGIVGVSYTPSSPLGSGATVGYTAALAQCQHYASHGSEIHEVKWLPSAADETWGFAGNTSFYIGPASVQLVLYNVDGTALTATQAAPNGLMEVTTVWEWIPSETSTNTGIVLDPRTPLPYTTQQVLSSITKLGEFLYSSGKRLADLVSGPAARSAIPFEAVGQGLLTAGIRRIRTRAPTMLVQN